MRKTFTVVLMLVCTLSLRSQQKYFVYIQDESMNPFYVRMGEESFSSSPVGHLVLSGLRDSVYRLFVGFPGKRNAEQLFTINVRQKDHGYDLKHIDGGWQLFDLQELRLIRPELTGNRDSVAIKRTDPYSRLMAGVVNDSAVLYQTAVPKESPKAEPPKTAIASRPPLGVQAEQPHPDGQANTPGSATGPTGVKAGQVQSPSKIQSPTQVEPPTKAQQPTQVQSPKQPVINTPPARPQQPAVQEQAEAKEAGQPLRPQPVNAIRYDKRDIIRLRTENVVDGRLMIYLDRSAPVTDTIQIVIPRL